MAKRLEGVWGRVSARTAPTRALAGYLEDVGKTKDSAVKDFQDAENDLKTIQQDYLKKGDGKKAKCTYQAVLANAYLGHFRLTGDQAKLKDAEAMITEALRGADKSPQLAAAIRLRELISEAGK